MQPILPTQAGYDLVAIAASVAKIGGPAMLDKIAGAARELEAAQKHASVTAGALTRREHALDEREKDITARTAAVEARELEVAAKSDAVAIRDRESRDLLRATQQKSDGMLTTAQRAVDDAKQREMAVSEREARASALFNEARALKTEYEGKLSQFKAIAA
jgi:uncharacterized protein (DUF3084 family)